MFRQTKRVTVNSFEHRRVDRASWFSSSHLGNQSSLSSFELRAGCTAVIVDLAKKHARSHDIWDQ